MRVSMMFTLAAPLAVALAVAPALAHGRHGGGACAQALLQSSPPLCSVTTGPGWVMKCITQLPAGTTLPTACDQVQAKITAWNTCKGVLVQQNLCPNITPGPGQHKGFIGCLRQLAQSGQVPGSCQPLLVQHHGYHHHHAPDSAPDSGQGNP
ncbi:MAG: hypothetical protein ABSA52_01215 [Candidatus Binatia bacterium]|jgi:hypothetical protein